MMAVLTGCHSGDVSVQCKQDAILFGAFKHTGGMSSHVQLSFPFRFTVLCISFRKLRVFCNLLPL